MATLHHDLLMRQILLLAGILVANRSAIARLPAELDVQPQLTANS